jgi:hypothetical protein
MIVFAGVLSHRNPYPTTNLPSPINWIYNVC